MNRRGIKKVEEVDAAEESQLCKDHDAPFHRKPSRIQHWLIDCQVDF